MFEFTLEKAKKLAQKKQWERLSKNENREIKLAVIRGLGELGRDTARTHIN